MTEYPVISASEATVVETPVVVETQSVTYDRWYMTDFACHNPDPNTEANAIAEMTKGRKVDGVWELSEEKVYVNMANIFTLAQTNEDVANAVSLILSLVNDFGREQNLL